MFFLGTDGKEILLAIVTIDGPPTAENEGKKISIKLVKVPRKSVRPNNRFTCFSMLKLKLFLLSGSK